jgi:hypothetical protein
MTLVGLLVNMPAEDRKEIFDAIQEADIARLSGNKKWRGVFKQKWLVAKGKKRKIYSALFKEKSPKALDSAWEKAD